MIRNESVLRAQGVLRNILADHARAVREAAELDSNPRFVAMVARGLMNDRAGDYRSELLPVAAETAIRTHDVYANRTPSRPDLRAIMGDTSDFVQRQVDGLADYSEGQLVYVGTEDPDRDHLEPVNSMQERADSWRDRRATHSGDMLARLLVGATALAALRLGRTQATYWQVSGSETCPYCTRLSTRRPRTPGRPFAGRGEDLGGAGLARFVVNRNVRTPPAHNGCDCILGIA